MVCIVTGGYGFVQKVKIHKDHHSFASSPWQRTTRYGLKVDLFQVEYKEFALKIMLPVKESGRDVFKQELTAFRKVRPRPNLVELVSAFEISGKDTFMLLFPWVGGGSMDDMMIRPSRDLFRSRQQSPKDFVQWITSQCRGLVEALGKIHQANIVTGPAEEEDSKSQVKIFGIHLDIEPTNILYFSQETANHPLGVLKIADLGLTRFHSQSSRTRKSRSTAYRCSQEYRSPEHDIGYIISRKVDIWALGCVFSELFTWMLLEHKAREDFRQARKQDALFSGDWSYVQNGENDIEDNFFQSHIEMKSSKTFHRLLRDHPKIGDVKQTRVARKEKAKLDQANSSASSR